MLRRLAEDPPLSAAALAGVPGVGVTLAERCGATILAALGDVDGAQPSLATDSDDPPLLTELIAWRRTAALALGAPDYVVLADDTLRAISVRRPADLAGLRAVPGLGPRALAKHGSSLLSLIQRKPPPC
ncbi:MAG: HRDC domain-containing protein [Gemmatimonadales bacterium]|nr:HRDC domain-containing protein [Gemmatimonadales bacterium]